MLVWLHLIGAALWRGDPGGGRAFLRARRRLISSPRHPLVQKQLESAYPNARRPHSNKKLPSNYCAPTGDHERLVDPRYGHDGGGSEAIHSADDLQA
ncbi:MAG: hypothetical protein DLM67_25165 [Candidatus Nephthysia bennettiae]|nr:MAG: hypothetical protein DLM67_25165 [Candidatus Dormibacteraeota bacterium]